VLEGLNRVGLLKKIAYVAIGFFFIFIQRDLLAKELIELYDSEVRINLSSDLVTTDSLTITDTVVIQVGGEHFKWGMGKTLPRFLEVEGEEPARIRYVIRFVSLNGNSTGIRAYSGDDRFLLLMGQQGRDLDHGRHTFQFQYETRGMVKQVSTGESLDLRLTRGLLSVPIKDARVRLMLPEGLKISDRSVRAYHVARNKRLRLIEPQRVSQREFVVRTSNIRAGEDLLFQARW